MSHHYLLVSVTAPPTLAFGDRDSPGRLLAFGRSYTEITFPNAGDLFLGFYDWLRTSQRCVVGVRLSLHRHCDALQQLVTANAYAEWVSRGILQIMFADPSINIDEEMSMDQDFMVTRVYRSGNGMIALLFDADALSPEDIHDLGAHIAC